MATYLEPLERIVRLIIPAYMCTNLENLVKIGLVRSEIIGQLSPIFVVISWVY